MLEWEPSVGPGSAIDVDADEEDPLSPSSSHSRQPGVLLFAGEALSKLDQQQVHGAMESGKRAAQMVLERLQDMAAAPQVRVAMKPKRS